MMDDDDIESSDDPSTLRGGEDRRLRREIANSNERKRMQSINAGFETLKSLLPGHQQGERMSKAAVLQQTVELMNGLQVELSRVGAALIHSRRRECTGSCSAAAASNSEPLLAPVTTASNNVLINLFPTDAETDFNVASGSVHGSSHNDSVECSRLHHTTAENPSQTDTRRLSACTDVSGCTSVLTATGSINISGEKRKLDTALLDDEYGDDELHVIRPENLNTSTLSPMPTKFRHIGQSNIQNELLTSNTDAVPSITVPDGIRSDQDDENRDEIILSCGKSPNPPVTRPNAAASCSYLFDIEAITLQVVELRRELDKERRARMRLEEECRRRKLDGPLCAECASKRSGAEKNQRASSRNLNIPTTPVGIPDGRSSSLRISAAEQQRSSSSLAMLSSERENVLQNQQQRNFAALRHDPVPNNSLLMNAVLPPNPNLSLLSPGNFNVNMPNKIDAAALASMRRSSLGVQHLTVTGSGGGSATELVKSENPIQILLPSSSHQQQQQFDLSHIARRQSADSSLNSNIFGQQPQRSLTAAALPNQFLLPTQQQTVMQPARTVSSAIPNVVKLDAGFNTYNANNILRLLPTNCSFAGNGMPPSSTSSLNLSSFHSQQQQPQQPQHFFLSNGNIIMIDPSSTVRAGGNAAPLQLDASVLMALQQQQHQQQQQQQLQPAVSAASNNNNLIVYNLPTNNNNNGGVLSSIFLPSNAAGVLPSTDNPTFHFLPRQHQLRQQQHEFMLGKNMLSAGDETGDEDENDAAKGANADDDVVDDEDDAEIQEIYADNDPNKPSVHPCRNDFDALLASATVASVSERQNSYRAIPNVYYTSAGNNHHHGSFQQFLMPTNVNVSGAGATSFEDDDKQNISENAAHWLSSNAVSAEQPPQYSSFMPTTTTTDARFNLDAVLAAAAQRQYKEHQQMATGAVEQQQQQRYQVVNNNSTLQTSTTTTTSSNGGGSGLGTLLEAIYHVESTVETPQTVSMLMPSTIGLAAGTVPYTASGAAVNNSPKKRIQAAVQQQQQQLLLMQAVASSTPATTASST